jgi:hypothetical protein
VIIIERNSGVDGASFAHRCKLPSEGRIPPRGETGMLDNFHASMFEGDYFLIL